MGDVGDGIGLVVTGALLAEEVERARAGAPAVGHAANEPCANCGATRRGPYCHECGQAGHVHRNLGALVHDLAHGVFHFEGKIWRTLPLLAWHPGRLTRRYVAGERARFVSPMALFLFSVFLMFAVVSNLAGHGGAHHGTPGIMVGGDDLRKELGDARGKLNALTIARAAANGTGRAALDQRIAEEAREIAVLDRLDKAGIADLGRPRARAPGAAPEVVTGIDWIDESIASATKNPELLLYKVKSYAYKYSWALIPISLPFMWLLFAFRRDVGLYDHAIFSIYSIAFMSLAVVALTVLGMLGVPTALIVIAALLIPPTHMYRQLKGAYRLGRFGAGWRTLALLFITFTTSLTFLMMVFYLGSE